MDYFYYIVIGDTPAGYPRAAAPFKTPMNHLEFEKYIGRNSRLLHESGKDRVFMLGTTQFVNPRIVFAEDFKNYCPYIIEN